MGTNRRDINTFISRRGLISLYKSLEEEGKLGTGGLRRLEELKNKKKTKRGIRWVLLQ